jgi:hypothetical protein
MGEAVVLLLHLIRDALPVNPLERAGVDDGQE